jgi:hypothetical protein
MQDAMSLDSDPPTPTAAPQEKVRRLRPSPFHKGSGKVAAATADGSESDLEEPAAVAPVRRAAPPRRGAAATQKQYAVDLVSDEEASDSGDNGGLESDDDDDFCPTD